LRSPSAFGTLSAMSQPPPPLPPRPAVPLNYAGGRACPTCGGRLSEPSFTWWGGALGHKMLGVERCESCKQWWVKKTGQSGSTRVAIYAGVGVALGLIVGFIVMMRVMH